MTTIKISKTTRFVLITFLLLGAVTAAATVVTPRVTGRSLSQVVGLDSGQAAAVAGATLFYSVDYREDPLVWAARLCEISTEQGCFFYEKVAAPGLWPGFEAAKTLTTAEVTEGRKVHEERSGEGQSLLAQVWEVKVNLSAPWPQSASHEKVFTTYALVIREEEGWKFERLLMDVEVEQYRGGKQ